MPVYYRNGVPQCTLEDYNTLFADRHLLHGIIRKWAQEKPNEVALINAETKEQVTWDRFDKTTTALAMKLLQMGFRKGDFLATSLPYLIEHIFLEYACFKIGVIHTPLDLRLKAPEVIRGLGLVNAKGYAFLGRSAAADFGQLGQAVMANCPFIEHFIQFAAPGETIPGGLSAFTLAPASACASAARVK